MTRGLKSPLSFSMEKLENRIKEIAEEAIEDNPALFLVDVLIKGSNGNQKLLLFVDGDNGVTIDDCSRISRRVGSVLEEEDLIAGKYFLEVSSPGLDHPIKLKRQYQNNIGRKLEVKKLDGEIVKGKLLNVGSEDITLEIISKEKEERLMSFKEINQSKIEVSFK